MTFTEQIEAFAEKAVNNAKITLEGTSIKLFSAVVTGTPVGKYNDGSVGGRLRGNWQAGYQNPIKSTLSSADKNGSDTIAKLTNKIAGAGKTEYTLSNNLPYASVIEFGGYPGSGPNTVNGYSKQAPSGMVRVNVTRFEKILEEEAKKYI